MKSFRGPIAGRGAHMRSAHAERIERSMSRRWPCDAVTRCVTCEMEHGPSIIICILSPIFDVGTINVQPARAQNVESALMQRRLRCTACMCIAHPSDVWIVPLHPRHPRFTTDDWSIVSTSRTIEIIASHSRVSDDSLKLVASAFG